jgi:hypothetical protein
MSHLLEHAADLPVAAFDQRDLVPRVGRVARQLDARRRRFHQTFSAVIVFQGNGDA